MKKIIGIFLGFLSLTTKSQDIHFSQFYSVPVLINPAEAGRIKEDARFTAIYRTQWSTLKSSFNSTGISTDFVILPPFLKKDNLGLGIYAVNDNLGSGIMKGSSVYLSFAYHAFLDKVKRHRLSGGIQGGYTSKSVDNSNFQYYNQFVDFSFVSSRDSKESSNDFNYHYFDGQAGLFYGFTVNPKFELNFGSSFYQLKQPKETVIANGSNNKLGTRSIYTLGAKFKLSDKITLNPQIMYMRQSKAEDFNLGSMLIYTIPHSFPIILIGGVFHRNNDALIGLVGMRYKALEIRYSYDMTTSSAKQMKGAQNTTNRAVGAHEFVLNFYGKLTRKNTREYTIPCGIF